MEESSLLSLYDGLPPLMVPPTLTLPPPPTLTLTPTLTLNPDPTPDPNPNQVRQVLFGMVKFLIFDFCSDALLAQLPFEARTTLAVSLGAALLSNHHPNPNPNPNPNPSPNPNPNPIPTPNPYP